MDICYAGAKRDPGQRIGVTLPPDEWDALMDYLAEDETFAAEVVRGLGSGVVYGVDIQRAKPMNSCPADPVHFFAPPADRIPQGNGEGPQR